MYLEKLEIQGFKSFAEKTTFLFPGFEGDRYGITAVIGPNGSGKSNVADGIRWVLGEQSLKLLRSKRAEDVIFFGSSQKAQKGFCEVALYFNNDDHVFPVDYSEVVITRRLYRDGASEYLLNKNKVRLADIALMLAQAHIGQKSYSVIGQGMIDAILQTAPADRKEFFNEAVGVRQYQIKRDSAASKLKSTNENLTHAQTVLSELEPKMRFFARQLKRLEEREEVEREYIALQKQYTNVLWNDLKDRKNTFEKERTVHQEKSNVLDARHEALEQEFVKSEKTVRSPVRSSFQTLSQQLFDLQKEKQQIVTRISVVDSRLQTELVASGKGQLAWLTGRKDELTARIKNIDEERTGLEQDQARLRTQEEKLLARIKEQEERAQESHDIGALEKVLQEIEELGSDAVAGDSAPSLKEALQKIVIRIRKARETARALMVWLRGGRRDGDGDLARVREELHAARTQSEVVAARMTLRQEERAGLERDLAKTAHELSYLSQTDLSDQHAAAAQEKEALIAERESVEAKIAAVQKELDGLYETEQETHRNLLELQKHMSALSKEHDAVRDALNRASLEIAKLEAHQEELLAKICDELRVSESARAELSTGTETVYSALGFFEESPLLDCDVARGKIEHLRRKLEQIGTIDQDVIAEHEEAKG
ncbi:MAG: AAA family ATPase, partial [Patescibacteria group bacterium]